MKQDAVPSPDELGLEDEWFSEPSTWKPPHRRSARPPSIPAAPAMPVFEEDDVDRWFV